MLPFRRGMVPMLIKKVPYTIGRQVHFAMDLLFGSILFFWGIRRRFFFSFVKL
jgi:hypothetical protein